ncbi:hypothetical protein GWN42_15090, partial [candidate division KSB1 bacterium]|nr:hypothetical protein [candidate division KSB1 bacterium]
MDKISKFEKELERREISDSERKLKVKINYARALVNFLPGGSKLDKLIFGLVDAKREQELDDILALLVEQIGELKLSQLSFSTQLGEAIEELRDFRLNWSEIGQELEIIIDGVQGIHYELSEHKKLLHDISNKVDKI